MAYPGDQTAASITSPEKDVMTIETDIWDYVVVGAGSAGAIVAARLSEDRRKKVLLLEAGGPSGALKFRVPALGVTRVIGNPDCDWMFFTEPDSTRNNRVDMWPRGKALGGSSIMNGTIYVRGNRSDYDHWAQLGNSGWDYDSLLAHFRAIEHGDGSVSGDYGRNGPVHIAITRGAPSLASVFVKAMNQIGIPDNPCYNGENQTGAAITHVNQKNGWRASTVQAYIDRIRNRKNLKIVTRAFARRVLFEGRRAVGVEFERDGVKKIGHCRGDIAICASAFNTPKLLMLSGIGDPAHLSAHGVPIVHANPAVGRNLQEHPYVPLKAFVNTRTTNMDMKWFGQLKFAVRYALTGGGPASYIFPAIAFVKSDPDLEYPDLEYQFGTFASEVGPTGLKWLDKPAVTILVNVNRSSSNGRVELRSGDPHDPPMIHPNMLSHQGDVDLLKKGVRIGRALFHTQAFSPYFVSEYLPGDAVCSDSELEQFVRREASPSYHACGTAKMGIDEQSVVDPRLRVRGVEGLRVIDCSIIPQVPSGNTNAISMVIGEKGAAMMVEATRSA